MNPRTLNRYSYCLNNPLKYIDPSGHAGEGLPDPTEDGQLGYTGKDKWLISKHGKWVPIDNGSVDRMLAAYIHSNASTWTSFASAVLSALPLSDSLPSGYSGINLFTMDGKQYTWGIQFEYDRKKDIMSARLTLVEQYDEVKANLIICESIAVAGDVVSFWGPLMVPGWVASTAASTIGLCITANEYNKGNITHEEFGIVMTNFVGGLIPWGGAASAAFQFWLDW
jgi:hypothetical protein